MDLENASIIINESVNQTVNASSFPGPVDYAFHTLWPRIVDLVLAPVENPDMLWTLAPMMVALVLMQLYFGRNKDESLGWNTAFGNSIALIFISSSLLRGLFIASGHIDFMEFLENSIALSDMKILVVLAIFLYGLLLSLISFFHWLPEALAFFIMNGISINVTAYVCIVLVNSENIPLDRNTLFAGIIIFVVVYVVSIIIRSAIPQSVSSRKHRFERQKYILEAEVRLYEDKAGKAKSDRRKSLLHAKADKYRSKIKEVDDMVRKL